MWIKKILKCYRIMKMKQYNTNHFESWWNPLYIYSSSIWGKKRFVKTFSYYTIQLPQVEPKKKKKTKQGFSCMY